jgi:hypothetical protein
MQVISAVEQFNQTAKTLQDKMDRFLATPRAAQSFGPCAPAVCRLAGRGRLGALSPSRGCGG